MRICLKQRHMKNNFDISKITDYLYISELPHQKDIDTIHDLNIDLVISMTWHNKPKALESFNSTHIKIRAIDSPLFPIPMNGLINGAKTAIPIIKSGGRVLVHCKHGVHRSVAMTACILIANGYSSTDAIKLIKNKRKAAKPETFYIKKRIIKFEKEWSKNA